MAYKLPFSIGKQNVISQHANTRDIRVESLLLWQHATLHFIYTLDPVQLYTYFIFADNQLNEATCTMCYDGLSQGLVSPVIVGVEPSAVSTSQDKCDLIGVTMVYHLN